MGFLCPLVTTVCILVILAFASVFSQVEILMKAEEDAEFSCPPEDSISPCLCQILPLIPTVRCGGVRTLKSIQKALANRFNTYPIPYLKVHDCDILRLPSKAFLNISATRMLISNANLSSVADDAFDGMESLLLLVLHNVFLQEFPSDAFVHLPSLVTLSLPNNKLSRLTRNDLRHIAGVKYFSVSNNRISHIETGALPLGLSTLCLSSNHIATLNRTVRNLPFLEWLILSDNRLTDVEGDFDGLYNLEILTLRQNLINTLGASFKDLNDLKILELQYNSLSSLGDSLKNLRQLELLNLSHNMLSDMESDTFSGLVSLVKLDLSANRLMSLGNTLSPLSRLANLYLSNNFLSEVSFDEIRTLISLRVMDLSTNTLSTLTNSTLHPYALRLKILILRNNELENIGEFLSHFPLLEDLDISYNRVSRLHFGDFNHMRRLESIVVKGNSLVCDLQQLHAIRELMNRNVEVIGYPSCSVSPVLL